MTFNIKNGILISIENPDKETEVIVPDGVRSIGKSAFFGSSVQRVVFPDSLEEIGDGAFSSCSALTSLSFGKGLRQIGRYAFYSCGKLESIDLPDSVEEIGEYAFGDCGLCYIKLGNGLRRIWGCAFLRCIRLADIEFPESLEMIDRSALDKTLWEEIHVGEMVMANSHLLLQGDAMQTDVVIPNGVKEIAGEAFSSYARLRSIVFPPSLRVIGMMAFEYCDVLKEIHLNEGLESIEAYSFYECRSVSRLEIPSTVRYINESALYFSRKEIACVAFENGNISAVQALEFETDEYYYIDSPYGIDSDNKKLAVKAIVGFIKKMTDNSAVPSECIEKYHRIIAENIDSVFYKRNIYPFLTDYLLVNRLLSYKHISVLLEEAKGDLERTARLLEYGTPQESFNYDI